MYIEKIDNKKLKCVASTQFDMSTVVGGYMQYTNNIQISKDFVLNFKMGVLPACPKLHS